MRRFLVTGALGLLGIVMPVGSLSMATAASSSPSPVLFHVPIVGAHAVNSSNATTQTSSTNWGGYAATTDTFQTVTSSWVEPTVTCSAGAFGLGHARAAYSAFWIGLDGYTSSSVEQTGTDSDCTSQGKPSYYAWYEMYPAGSVDLSTTKYPVAAGNTLTGTVTSNAAGSSFTLSLVNNTRGWTFSITLSGSGLARSSAEWIAEAPSECTFVCTVLPLADFGKVNFTSASTTDTAAKTGSISAFSNVEITMETATGTPKATPSALSSNGAGFSMTWDHS